MKDMVDSSKHSNKTAEVTATSRSAIIRQVKILANDMPLALPFQHYDPENTIQIKTAADLLAKLYPNLYYSMGMAFALMMNPISPKYGYTDWGGLALLLHFGSQVVENERAVKRFVLHRNRGLYNRDLLSLLALAGGCPLIVLTCSLN